MKYGEAFSHDIVADLFCAAIHIGAIGLYKTLKHAFFLAVGLGLIEFRVFVRQPSFNLYTELCIYKFAKFNNFCGDVAFILDKAYECGLYNIIRYYKKVVDAVSNGRRY